MSNLLELLKDARTFEQLLGLLNEAYNKGRLEGGPR